MAQRIAVTIRFPRDLVDEAKSREFGARSFNDLVVKALEREIRRREWGRVLKRIDEREERIYHEHGLLSDSRQLIRDLREGIGRWD